MFKTKDIAKCLIKNDCNVARKMFLSWAQDREYIELDEMNEVMDAIFLRDSAYHIKELIINECKNYNESLN
jgi:hypothetical protein